MRKLILVSILSLFSAFAFSQEASRAEPVTASDVVAATGSQPANTVDSAARAFGSFLGRMVKAPVDVVTSVAAGVREGFTADTTAAAAPSAPAAVVPAAGIAYTVTTPASAPTNVAAAPTAAPDMVALAAAKVAAFRSMLVSQAVGKQAPAPVEDRSAPARLDF